MGCFLVFVFLSGHDVLHTPPVSPLTPLVTNDLPWLDVECEFDVV